MTELTPFMFQGNALRTAELDGQPAIVLADIAKILGYRNAPDASRILRPHHKGYAKVRTPGGEQEMIVVTEKGFNRLVLKSNAPNADQVQDWVTDEVLPSISETGSYGTKQIDLNNLNDLGLLLEAGKAALGRAIEAEARAEASESRLDVIEGGKGFSIREFHKHYFPDVPERKFFELLYQRRILIDQRGARGRDKNGKLKNGKQHMHPGYAGKPYFFLDPYIHAITGDRHYNTKVRPGRPETELVELLKKYGLPSNQHNIKEITK